MVMLTVLMTHPKRTCHIDQLKSLPPRFLRGSISFLFRTSCLSRGRKMFSNMWYYVLWT